MPALPYEYHTAGKFASSVKYIRFWLSLSLRIGPASGEGFEFFIGIKMAGNFGVADSPDILKRQTGIFLERLVRFGIFLIFADIGIHKSEVLYAKKLSHGQSGAIIKILKADNEKRIAPLLAVYIVALFLGKGGGENVYAKDHFHLLVKPVLHRVVTVKFEKHSHEFLRVKVSAGITLKPVRNEFVKIMEKRRDVSADRVAHHGDNVPTLAGILIDCLPERLAEHEMTQSSFRVFPFLAHILLALLKVIQPVHVVYRHVESQFVKCRLQRMKNRHRADLSHLKANDGVPAHASGLTPLDNPP